MLFIDILDYDVCLESWNKQPEMIQFLMKSLILIALALASIASALEVIERSKNITAMKSSSLKKEFI